MSLHRHDLLVVDDDADARLALQELLELHGYAVTVVSDGEQALSHLRRKPAPCLVLLDLRMPGMNGWQFREAQLADPALRDIPVAVFSGDSQEDADAAALGVRLFLRKPLDVERLLTIIERHCVATAGSKRSRS